MFKTFLRFYVLGPSGVLGTPWPHPEPGGAPWGQPGALAGAVWYETINTTSAHYQTTVIV